MKISNCCGAKIISTDYDICPECKEHCYFEDESTIEENGIPELSDEEIERIRNIKYSHYSKEQVEAFIDGAKWYREQLKQ